jgi:D-galactose 1-dehydrogenase
MAIKLGIVGVGKIARDQHLPVLSRSSDFEIVAAASRNAAVEGTPTFLSLREMLDANPGIQAVSLCTPPVPRTPDARLALSRGVHVMLEKPPGATLSEVEALAALAARNGVVLHASWHSRHAPSVAAAKEWLRGKTVRRTLVTWKENIRQWHPGQDWILEPGGLGVFDPGINALSVVTHILPLSFALKSAQLSFPSNRQAPIAAELTFEDTAGAPVLASFDFLKTGEQTWDIEIETDGGRLVLSKGGADMAVNGVPVQPPAGTDLLHAEYESVYRHFAGLVAERRSEVDLAPLRHVADSFLLGERIVAPAFHF